MGTEKRFKTGNEKSQKMAYPGPGKYNMMLNWPVNFLFQSKLPATVKSANIGTNWFDRIS